MCDTNSQVFLKFDDPFIGKGVVPLRVGMISYPTILYKMDFANTKAHAPEPPNVLSKDDIMKLLSMMMYNQAGMAFKLAKVAAEAYAGLNFDFTA